MHPTDKTARVAGLLYLAMGIPAAFSEVYVPRTLIVVGNAPATANNILASEMLFRIGMVSELMFATVFIFLVRALYRLLNGVDKTYASLMVTLALVSVPISFLNVLNEIAALALLRGGDFLSVFEKRQMDALAMMFLNLHRYGFLVDAIFWGLWLFPFGILVMKSGFLPRILGILLIIGCFAWLAVSLTSLLVPSYLKVVTQVATLPQAAAELPIILWLLLKGAKVRPLAAPA